MATFGETLSLARVSRESDNVFSYVPEMAKTYDTIIGNNVLDYIWDKWYPGGGAMDEKAYRETFDAEMFPNMAPPFDDFVIAFDRFPVVKQHVHAGAFVDVWRKCVWGVMFQARSVMDTMSPEVIRVLGEWGESRVSLKAQGYKWILYTIPFGVAKKTKRVLEPRFCRSFFIKEDGSVGRNHIVEVDASTLEKHNLEVDEAVVAYDDLYEPFLAAAYTSIVMMHCRNIEVVDKRYVPSLGKRQKIRRNKSNAVTFKTIEIGDTLKRILRDEGEVERVGVPRALHKCRGHFKDYRFGNGLFGKHKDMYWFNAHMRGSLDYGRIVKDYAISSRG